MKTGLSFLFLFSCTTLGVAGGCSSSPSTEGTPTAASTGSPNAQAAPTTRTVEEWRRNLSKVRTPKAGCFQATHPSTTWVEVPCGNGAPLIPLVPRRQGGGKPEIVGDGSDFSAQAVGTISQAIGSFPVANVTSEVDSLSGLSNDFSIQLNSNPFYNAPQCSGAAAPASCQGWEQFAYTRGWLFIQYWLLDYGNTCPSGWTSYQNGPQLDCYRNSNNQTFVGSEAATNLQHISMTATANANDEVQMFDGRPTALTVSEPSLMNLSAGWTGAEYNVFGYGSGSQANFNDGASLDVEVELDNVPITPYAPACEPVGFTGETNNLNLETPCCAIALPPRNEQGIRFTEATAAPIAPTQQCPLYLNVNNSPLQVTQGGTSEAYVLMYGPWMTQDLGNGATGTVVANDAPGVTIQVAPGTTIDSAGALNLTVHASSTSPLGSYQASVDVTDHASGASFTATVPIDVICVPESSGSVCVAASNGSPMCGQHAAGCGTTVDCGTCPGGAACGANGYCPCVPTTTCGSQTCGSIVNNCGQTIECGTCSGSTACSSGICCPSNEVNSNGVCCPPGDNGGSGMCCPGGESPSLGHCCPTGEVWLTNHCGTVVHGGGGGGGGGCKPGTCM